jgi:hypothetical protein
LLTQRSSPEHWSSDIRDVGAARQRHRFLKFFAQHVHNTARVASEQSKNADARLCGATATDYFSRRGNEVRDLT